MPTLTTVLYPTVTSAVTSSQASQLVNTSTCSTVPNNSIATSQDGADLGTYLTTQVRSSVLFVLPSMLAQLFNRFLVNRNRHSYHNNQFLRFSRCSRHIALLSRLASIFLVWPRSFDPGLSACSSVTTAVYSARCSCHMLVKPLAGRVMSINCSWFMVWSLYLSASILYRAT